ncbi:cell division protein FtsK [Bifidobacterium sp. SMB2]|uniref:Cell division protein FtsK n=1 Tax=Bifidobacterium saimiriisciurei TaxID=2661627 RepID=A0ABX0CE17_9BIFI|nr:cell division protein FtsK [Bifidobacterium sp. SMB2]NEH10803.1 cell division protein FtsK [Bifidobacterium saimiriisciurei]
MAISMVAPVLGQSALLVVMIAERRWMFLCLVIPGLIGCLASAIAAMAAHRRRAMPKTSPDAGQPPPDDRNTMRPDAARCAMLHPQLEPLLGLEASRPDHLWRRIARNWHEASEAQRTCKKDVLDGMHDVAVGESDKGRTTTLNLPKAGPHALVAGTTGSGKSVLLESWCLSLACRFPPSMLNFVFLDFKGGAAFRMLHRLPHTVGFVSDLNLDHAVRALRAIEAELRRRERLVAEHHAAGTDELDDPPPRLMVVIDEFHALRQQLPDYMTQLVALASLGRSLGMHLIACTQNPMGQIGGDMKANIGLNICLRVRDPLQSTELLGIRDAAFISPQHPGIAYLFDGERRTAFRCAMPGSAAALIHGCDHARRFLNETDASPLFSPPLPNVADWPGPVAAPKRPLDPVPLGLLDLGVRLEALELPLDSGNIAIVGPERRGKTSILGLIRRQLSDRSDLKIIDITANGPGQYVRTVTGPSSRRAGRRPSAIHAEGTPPPPPQSTAIWLVDDADALLDPLCMDALHDEFMRVLADPRTPVVFALSSPRHLRFPDHCTMRILFPTGDRTSDMMAGIPSQALSSCNDDDWRTPGRGMLLVHGQAHLIQCFRLAAE